MKSANWLTWGLVGLVIGMGMGFGLLVYFHILNLPGKNGGLQNPISPTNAVVDRAAPDFMIQFLDGQNYQLSKNKGKPVVVNFWASWCEPCKSEMPLLEKLYETSGDRLMVIAINDNEGTEIVLDYVKQNHLHFPVGIDHSNRIDIQYQVNGLPTTLFIDGKGVLRAVKIGQMLDVDLQNYLPKIGVSP